METDEKFSWLVKTNQEELYLTSSTLLDLLFSKVNKVEREDFAVLIEEFCNFLNASKRLTSMNIMQVATLAFAVGYFYRLFLEKNKVEFGNSKILNKEEK